MGLVSDHGIEQTNFYLKHFLSMRRLQQSITSLALKRRSLRRPSSAVVVVKCCPERVTAGLSAQKHQYQYCLPHQSFSSLTPIDASSAQATSSRLPYDFLSILESTYPNLKISLNKYDLESHGHGESYHKTSPPDAVLYPSTVEEIQSILRLCCREVYSEEGDGIPTVEIVSVIPYGAGTSLEGHLNFLLPNDESVINNNDIVELPVSLFESSYGTSQLLKNEKKKVRIKRKGGISLDMCNFQSIGEIKPGDGFVKVGAGVTRNTLNDALRHTGMQFMIDPGADATIGGMTATAASGTAAVKYLTMRENVLGLNVVLPPRTISCANSNATGGSNPNPMAVHCGSNALKNSAGYNLPALFTGSEGTLGVITDVTVKVYPIPSHVIAASCAFDDLHSAAEVVTTIRMMGVPVSRIELLDEMSIRAFNQSVNSEELKPMAEKATLFLEFSGHSESSVMADLSAARAICVNEFEGSNFVSASDETTRQKVWAARHKLYYASIALRGRSDEEGATSQSTVVTDVCVPLSNFAAIISATAKDLRDIGVFGTCFGHAGDGNFHCILPFKKNDTEEYKEKVFRVIELMTDRALSVGGTCTGEHGVGYGKKNFLARMYGGAGVSLMQEIKRSIDPFGIMNPGKIVDSTPLTHVVHW
jgi:D-lactate dehydrogenase (cytochrome)